jgi:hypothetical protein
MNNGGCCERCVECQRNVARRPHSHPLYCRSCWSNTVTCSWCNGVLSGPPPLVSDDDESSGDDAATRGYSTRTTFCLCNAPYHTACWTRWVGDVRSCVVCQ